MGAESMMLGTISTSGSHGCIDCVIDKCHHCLCREALKRSPKGVANVIDPSNKAKNQYLVCEGSRITCHPCPKGLVWNCRNREDIHMDALSAFFGRLLTMKEGAWGGA